MPRRPKLIQLPLSGKIFLCVLAIVYQIYLIALVRFVYTSLLTHPPAVIEHQVNTSPQVAIQYWTAASMRNATEANEPMDNITQQSVDTSAGKAARQQGQLPSDSSLSYPVSTVGKVFFTNDSGQNMTCSGTAVVSLNHNAVDTAGHCLYWRGAWVHNMIFCPLYENGDTPYGCWAARDLEVPADWIDARPNDYHHDFGMAIVSPNSQGDLTNVVGGAGWAYNQPADQPFYAYGYPAGYPFDGQTRQSCENVSGKIRQHGGGSVVSIPCGMTGGSSGGPWFIQIDGHWYLNGHNDFTSSIEPGHMFSPYYDDTWYALYDKAQHS